MAEDPIPQLPPGLQWIPPPDAPQPSIPVLPPGMQWEDRPGRGGVSVHPSEKIPQMPGTPPGPTGFERFFTAEGRAIDPTTKQPYREIRDLVGMLPEARVPGLGEVPFMGGRQSTAKSMMVFEPDEAKRAEYLLKMFPNAKVRTEGREIIFDIPDIDPKTGKPFGAFTMNRVGMSPQDFDEVVNEATLFGPAARLTGLGSSWARRSLLAGATTGATEATRQGVSMLGGARKDISAPDVLISAGAATILNGISEPAFGLLRRAFATKALTNVNGQMTAQGRMILERIGLDPDTVTLQTLRELEPLMARARTPEEALRLAQARSLDVPVTRGDITRDPKIAGLEQRVAHGGTPGLTVLPSERRLFELKKPEAGEQALAVQEALNITSKRVSGLPTEFSSKTGQVITPQGSTFEAAHQRLVQAAKDMRNQFKAAYQEAIDRGAAMMPGKVSSLSHDLQKIKEAYAAHPQVGAIADDLAGIIKKANADGATPIQLQQLEERVRKSISALGQDINPALKSAGGELRQAYKKWEDALAPDDFIKGGPEAVAAFQRGRQIRTDYASRFEDDDAIAAMLKAKRMPPTQPGGKPTWEIEMPSSEAIRGILARPGDRGAATMERLKRVLALAEGPDGPLWQGVKREVYAELTEKGQGSFVRAWEAFTRDRKKLADVVFTPVDKAHLETMSGVAHTVTPVPGARNTSNSLYELGRQVTLPLYDRVHAGGILSGVNPTTAVRAPMMSRAAPFPLRAVSVTTGESADPPDAETVARFLRSQFAAPGQQ